MTTTFPTHSSRRINAIAQALGSTSYTEIGVYDGRTFLSVNVLKKAAIDPTFKFDINAYSSENSQFYSMTSDEYFSSLPLRTSADIYYIDGLHTFEQTLRDLNNTVSHCHASTVWLIDDTKPTDVFSSLETPHQARKYRKMMGSDDLSWHGDVFRLVFYIHDFIPCLNYRTIVGGANTQTLLWLSKSEPRKPRFGKLESICRLTYFDLHDNIDILRECSEDEALTLCIREVISDYTAIRLSATENAFA